MSDGRQTNAIKHGAYAYQVRGEAALDASQRGVLAELRDQFKTRQGMIDVLTDEVIDAVIIRRILKSHVVQQVQAGTPIERVTALKALGTFENSAIRGIVQLLAQVPDDSRAIDITELLKGGNDDGDS